MKPQKIYPNCLLSLVDTKEENSFHKNLPRKKCYDHFMILIVACQKMYYTDITVIHVGTAYQTLHKRFEGLYQEIGNGQYLQVQIPLL